MTTTSSKKLLAELSAFASQPGALESAKGRQLLLDALASKNAQATIHAAKLIAEQEANDFEPALRAAYRALCREGSQHADPGAHAREALVTALDAIESSDLDLFAEAALYVQLERGTSKGLPRDTGAGVRARGVLGLARLGHPDLWPILGMSLADREPSVRLSAARAVAHRDQRDGAGLLLMRLRMGDDTPEVLVECIRGLFTIAPDFGIRYARLALRDPNPDARAQILNALGTAPKDSAVELLADELASRSLGDERRPIIEALGLSLRPKARDILLELLEGDRTSDAEAALAALAIHRYDSRLVAQIEQRVSHSRDLARRFRELFQA